MTPLRPKVIPPDVQASVYEENKTLYNSFQWGNLKGDKSVIGATVILLAACQDNQTAADGDRNGLFTEHLKDVWNGGRFLGCYYDFLRAISLEMPPTQTPNYYTVGASNPAFESQEPFSISPSTTVPDQTPDQVPDEPQGEPPTSDAYRVLASFTEELQALFKAL
jgi:hypothetical protein